MLTHIFGITAYSFFGFLAAIYLIGWASYIFWINKIPGRYLLFTSLLSIFTFFAGSRLLFGILYFDLTLQNPSLLFEPRLSNFTLYGGLVSTFFTLKFITENGTEKRCFCVVRNALKRLMGENIGRARFLKIADHIAPHVGLSVAIMRLGCFFNGCCFGKPTDLPWGMYFARADSHPLVQMLGSNFITRALFNLEPVLRHPTQLYELLVAILASLAGWWIGKKYRLRGLVAAVFAWVFTLGRLIVFFFRDFPVASFSSDMIRGPVVYGLCLIYISFWIAQIFKQNKIKIIKTL